MPPRHTPIQPRHPEPSPGRENRGQRQISADPAPRTTYASQNEHLLTNPPEYIPNVGAVAMQNIARDGFGRWSAQNWSYVPWELKVLVSAEGANFGIAFVTTKRFPRSGSTHVADNFETCVNIIDVFCEK